MITVINTRAYGHALTYIDVAWELAPTLEPPNLYRFDVEASEAEAGPFTPVAVGLVDRYYVRDNSISRGMHHRSRWYRIKTEDVRTGDSVYTPAFTKRGTLSLEAAEMARQFSLNVRMVHGQRFVLLPIRTFGARCGLCRTTPSGRQTTTRCAGCWGVGFAGGYHWPVETWGNLDEVERTPQLSETQRTETQHHRFRTETSPEITPLSILVDRMNRRFRIIQISPTTEFGVTIHHEGTASLLPETAVEYEIPLVWPAGRDLPPGLHSLPHTLQGRAGSRTSSARPGGRR